MKTRLPALVLLAAAALTACSGSDDQVATDPAGTTPTPAPAVAVDPAPPAPPAPAAPAAPAAPGTVFTRGLATVIDSGAGPQVCLGPIDAIYPPRCTGPALVGWTWDDLSTTEGATRFGSYALTGTWDGTTLTVTGSIGAALYDAARLPEPTAPPAPATSYAPAELDDLAHTLTDTVPGALTASADDAGHVLLEVAYDDGSIQAWADGRWGTGVVVVTSDLVDAS